MKPFLSRLMISLGLGFLLSTAASATDSERKLAVSMEITNDDTIVGRPTIVLTPGVPATMTVDREGGYLIQITAHRTAGGGITVESEISLREGDSWVPAAAPKFEFDGDGRATSKVIRRATPGSAGGRFGVSISVSDADATL